MRTVALLITTLGLTVSLARPAIAQDLAPPAHFSYIEGTVTLVRSGGEYEQAVVNLPVVPGDRIETADGRAEVLCPDGSAIEIDPQSAVEFLSTTRVRVLAGAIEHRSAADVNAYAAQSSANLPTDLQTYAPDMDQGGTWETDASYGTVWYPTVDSDWRPYSNGYWATVPAYGWTWIGYDRWAWPTHHYGRWGFAHSRWFWIPGRSFAAAWVSWGTAPDYVSWCPLGYDERPVVALSVGYRRNWNAWTIVPRENFGYRGYAVSRYAVDASRVPANTAFIVHRTTPPVAIGRSAASVAAQPGYGSRGPNVAVPRNGSFGVTGPTRGVAAPRGDRGAPAYPSPAYQRQAPSYQPPTAYQRQAPASQPPAYPRQAPTYQPPSAVQRQAPNQAAPAYPRSAPSYSPPAIQRQAPSTYQPPAYQRQAPAYQPPAIQREPAYSAPSYQRPIAAPRNMPSERAPIASPPPRYEAPRYQPPSAPSMPSREAAPVRSAPMRVEAPAPRSEARPQPAPQAAPRAERGGGESRGTGNASRGPAVRR